MLGNHPPDSCTFRFPSSPPTKKELLSTKSSFFVYPSRRLGIDARRLAIPSLRSLHRRAKRGAYHQPLWGCISSRASGILLRLDEIQHSVLMICNSFGIDDIHAYGVIGTRDCGKFLNYFAKYDIIPLKGVIVWLKTIY